jgi:hypothetical protein
VNGYFFFICGKTGKQDERKKRLAALAREKTTRKFSREQLMDDCFATCGGTWPSILFYFNALLTE